MNLNWNTIVSQLERVLAPGGVVELQERTLVMQDPTTPYGVQLNRLIRTMCLTFGNPGSELGIRIIQELSRLQLELEPVFTEELLIPMGSWGGWLGEMMRQLYETKLWSAKMLIDAADDGHTPFWAIDETIQGWRRELNDKESRCSFSCTVIVARKPDSTQPMNERKEKLGVGLLAKIKRSSVARFQQKPNRPSSFSK